MIYTPKTLQERIETESACANKARNDGAELRAIYLEGYRDALTHLSVTVTTQAAEIKQLREALSNLHESVFDFRIHGKPDFDWLAEADDDAQALLKGKAQS